METVRYISVVVFASNLAHGWFLIRWRASYVRHRTAILVIFRLYLFGVASAMHLMSVRHNLHLALSFYREAPELKPPDYEVRSDAFPVLIGEGGSGGLGWLDVSRAPYCTAAADLGSKMARLPIEMFFLYSVLQTVGSHLNLHVALPGYVFTVAAGYILRWVMHSPLLTI